MGENNANTSESLTINLAEALGAEPGVFVQSISIYVPSRDRVGKPIDNQRKWVLEVLSALTEMSTGASAMPSMEGAWVNEQKVMVWDNPVLVYSFIDPVKFAAGLPRLREFLHRLGRDTNQGEVAFEFGPQFFRILKFDAFKSE